MTVREWINNIGLFLEDFSVKPKQIKAIPNKLVYHHLLIVKNSVIIQGEEAKNRYSQSEAEVYSIDCVEMKTVDLNECPCSPKRGCEWMRSVEPLPDRIGDKLDLVSLPGDRSKGLTYQSIMDFKDRSSSRYSFMQSEDVYTIKNKNGDDYLYAEFYKGQTPKYLSVDIKALDLLDLGRFHCGGKSDFDCDFMDMDMHVDEKYQEIISKKVAEVLYSKRRMGIGYDRLYDNIDGTK